MNRSFLSLLAALTFVVSACSPTGDVETPFAPASVIVASGEVGRSTVALSPDGTQAYVAWVQRVDSTWNVWLRAFDRAGNNAGEPVRVNATPGNATVHAQAPPQVGVDTEGRLYVAWINRIDVPGRRFPANDLFVAVSEDGGRTFGPERPVNSDFGGTPAGHTFHNLAALPDGSMLISWIDSRDRSPAPTGESMSDHAAMHEESGSQIRVARIEDGGRRITETAILDRSSCPCCRTFITVSDSGRIFVAWRHEFESGERDVVLAHSDDGGRTFSDWRPIHRDHWFIEGCPHTGPVLGVDATGAVHAAWYTGADGAGIRHAVSTDGGETFSTVSPVLTDIPVSQAALVSGTKGTLELVMEDPAARELMVWSTRSGNEQGRLGGELPSAASSGGAAVLTWRSAGDILLAWR